MSAASYPKSNAFSTIWNILSTSLPIAFVIHATSLPTAGTSMDTPLIDCVPTDASILTTSNAIISIPIFLNESTLVASLPSTFIARYHQKKDIDKGEYNV